MLFFHMVFFMPLLSFSFTRTNPYTHLRGMTRAMAVSFGCASSAVTLPTNMLCCEDLGYQPSIVRFVLSLGATVSMDGVAIYLPAVIIWLAYEVGMTLSFGQIVVLSIISTLASAGASPTPGGIPLLILCWGSVFPGVPVPEQVAYIAAIDWFVDRCITTVNITGDSFITKIVDHSIREDPVVQEHLDGTKSISKATIRSLSGLSQDYSTTDRQHTLG